MKKHTTVGHCIIYCLTQFTSVDELDRSMMIVQITVTARRRNSVEWKQGRTGHFNGTELES